MPLCPGDCIKLHEGISMRCTLWKKTSEQECCDSLSKFHERLHGHHREFIRYHRWFRYARPVVLLFNLTILYLLFRWAGIKAAGICFAVLIVIKEIVQFVFLLQLEKRIITPIEELRQGVDAIARGNYDVRVQCRYPNDLGLLIESFNEMAVRLQEGERIKTEYENNRKSLIANISHDLKTPITSIKGYIEALLDGSIDSSIQREKYLKIIHYNIDYLNRLIDDLFLFSKLDMQKLDFHFERVSIRKYFGDLIEEFRLELMERQIVMEYEDGLTGEMYAALDGKRFYQAVNNLVRNAVQHGPEQGLVIRMRLYKQEAWIAVDIADNGDGIAQEKLPHIFERFFRIDTERAKDGTGLGLAIAKELLQAHGGEITVKSSRTEGTCFTIFLPEYSNNEAAG